jgi:putative DNA primase/helicase
VAACACGGTRTMSTEQMCQAGGHYTDVLGFAVVPIHPNRKKPVEGLTDWQRRRLDSGELDRHIRDGCGLGAVHGLSGTATLDADGAEEHVASALATVGVDFVGVADAGPATVGNPERPAKPWFLVPAGYDLTRRVLTWPKPGDTTKREVVLELRAGAAQDVLPPTIHPGTGEPYHWTPDAPISREDLPLIPGPLLGLWLAWDQLRPLMEAACPWAARPAPAHRPRASNGRSYEGPSIIEAWNKRVDTSVVLERNGYKQDGAGRWICPDSTTGDAGVVALDSKVYSHHASDLLGDGHAHDAFDCLRLLEHNGDAREAARSAAQELGLDSSSHGPSRSSVTVAGGAR